LTEEGNRQQAEGDGPGVVESLSLLGGQQVIRLEQQQVIEEGVEYSECQIVEGTTLDVASSSGSLP
jgi:hypothetical protein